MKYLLSISIILCTLSLPAQEPVPNETSGKGVTPLSSPSADEGGQEGATYAVVVGISDLSYASEIQVLSCQHAPARPKVSTNHP